MKMMNKKLHFLYSPYYLSLAGCFQVLIAYIINPKLLHFKEHFTDYFKEDLKWDTYSLVIAAIGAIYAQIAISIAFKYAEVSILSPLTYLNIPIFFIIDSHCFDVDFYPQDYVGSGMVIVCLVIPIIKLMNSKYRTGLP